MADAADASAPGRVNLIGEHTDYHEGYVLPTVIPQRTHVSLRRREDTHVRAQSTAIGEQWDEYELGAESSGRGWLDYVQGVTAMLAGAGFTISGFDLRVDSTIPLGAGVSSSAALEVALLRALRSLLSLDLDDVQIAKVARKVETDFVGAPIGIMDQMACSLGRPNEALFIDTRTLGVERLPLPRAADIAVIDSGLTHEHASGEYATRRRESFEAAALLGVRTLRDADPSMLPRIAALPPVLAKRARHIVTENARVLAAVDAIRREDAPALGALFNASHASMRADYEVSTPEIDTLVDIGQRHPSVFGARMTGGGFGGAVVILVRKGDAGLAASAICSEYRRTTGGDGTVLVPPAS